MKPEEFVRYGGFHDTIKTFLAGYDDLVCLVRGYMILSLIHISEPTRP